MNELEANLRDAVRRAGWFNDFALEPMRATGNNRVFKLQADSGEFLVKEYFSQPEDPRDRFATERAFYTCLWDAGVRRTPRPVAWEPDHRIALFEFIRGEKPATATHAMLQQALEFFHEINRHRHSAAATALPAASEACFTIREHLDRVDFRVARLGKIDPANDLNRSALDFVTLKLAPAWQRIKTAILTRDAASLDETLAAGDRRISPSDFGFHNSIAKPDGKLLFFDFEYAGWDDPAKTVCDFFCQPAVPADRAWMDEFVSHIAGKSDLPGLRERASLLLPVYQIKWDCIMLNEFLPTDSRRRAFSNPEQDITERKRKQLEKAADSLQQLSL